MRKTLSIIFFLFLILYSPAETDPNAIAAERQLNTQQYDSAIFSFTQLINVNPGVKELYFNRGLCYYHTSQFDQAIENFNICIALDSNFKDARYLKALSLEKQGKNDMAILEFQQLYKADKTYDALEKRIKTYRVSVYLSRNWYYMIALAVLLIMLMGFAISAAAWKKG